MVCTRVKQTFRNTRLAGQVKLLVTGKIPYLRLAVVRRALCHGCLVHYRHDVNNSNYANLVNDNIRTFL